MKVKLRQKTMRLAGLWFLDHIEKNPHLRQLFQADTLAFMTSFATRSSGNIAVERAFAERFVQGWYEVFHGKAPHLCWQMRPYPRPVATGEEAIAEIVSDMHGALKRRRGREPIDPIDAFETNERHKRSRRQTSAGVSGEYSHERTASDLGVNSKGAISEAIRKGRATKERIDGVMRKLPSGSMPLFVLTDAHQEGESGVMCVAIPPRKQDDD